MAMCTPADGLWLRAANFGGHTAQDSECRKPIDEMHLHHRANRGIRPRSWQPEKSASYCAPLVPQPVGEQESRGNGGRYHARADRWRRASPRSARGPSRWDPQRRRMFRIRPEPFQSLVARHRPESDSICPAILVFLPRRVGELTPQQQVCRRWHGKERHEKTLLSGLAIETR
jgi:hypothetical protein